MKVIFRESDHTYWLGDKQLISVTQFLKKHGLSTNYANIDPEVLAKAAEKGKVVHKEIEDYNKNGDVGFTSELYDYIEIVGQLDIVSTDSEVLLPAGDIPEEEADKYTYAGTADIIARTEDGKLVLADIKTTSKVDKRAYAWQLALYERLLGKKVDARYIFHLGASSKAVPIEPIPEAEVDRLLECEAKGEIYTEPGLVVSSDLVAQVMDAELTLKEAERAKSEAEAAAKELRARLYEVMEQQGIASWESLDKTLLVTYVAPTTKTSIDSTRLKKELPEIAEKYTKTSNVSGYVKVTVREG